tara:strand:- start:26 stop:973 length:948 start_codon:yes stop_codon:yes gene_type:complete
MEPVDNKLYNKTKKYIYKKYPKHSAYRSGLLVKKYKKDFTKKYGKRRQPYIGKRTKKKGLSRWFLEKWTNQRGKVGYKNKNDVYRPQFRITKKTPTTFNELNNKQINRARTEKYTKGRVFRFKKGGNKTKKIKNKIIIFKDYPEFKPNLTPKEMFELGSFGGTYWRPIYSGILKKKLKNIHKKYPNSWWKNIPEHHLSSSEYDNSINKYNVKVGTSLKFWESKKWIKSSHPYGWVHWYCDFYSGKRSTDDERQIKRWQALAGHKGRFMRFLVTQIQKRNSVWNDDTISPKIRQVLQHWGYKLTKKDFDYEINRRK